MKNNCFHRATLVVATSLLTLTASADLAISDVAGLKAFRDAVNAGNTYSGQTVYLTTDIDLNNESWTPIGYSQHEEEGGFYGTFDGKGYKISNIKVDITSEGLTLEYYKDAYAGLFGINEGVIKNLYIHNVNINGTAGKSAWKAHACAGGIAGLNRGSIINCCVSGSGSISSHHTYTVAAHKSACSFAGGIVGEQLDGECINCYFNGSSITLSATESNSNVNNSTNNISNSYSGSNSISGCCSSSADYAASWRMNRNYAAWLNNNIYGFENTDEPYTWDEDGITPEKHYSANISNALAEGIRDGYIVVSPTIPNTYKRNDGIVDVYSVDYNGANYMLYPEGTTVNVKVALEGWDLNTKNEQNEVTKAGWFIDKIYFTYDYTQNGNSAYEVGNEIAIRTNADGSAYEIGIPEEVNSATGRILREQEFSFTTPSGPTTVLYTTTNYDGLITSVDNVEMPIEISVEDNNIIAPADAEIYNINGVRVNNENLQSGIYIVRLGKQVKKIVVK